MLKANHTGFLPDPLRKGAVLKWLKRVHAWLGLWGGALGLLFGSTGILLNHRAVMKIPAVASVESTIQVALPDKAQQDPQAFARWLADYTHSSKPARPKVQPAKTVVWNDQPVQKPAEWSANVAKPGFAVQATWSVGNRYAEVKRVEQNAWGMLTQLHKANGLGAGWILLADTLAGALIVLSLTGFLLWSKLHGPRLLALGLIFGAVSWGSWAAFAG
ncbi:PepSY-associated TM helix domain-containing protein [Neisseriaceae bacterium JH1-16]|nr:PepSY-associated TM helix domain-containing protein [Neisseriaceae bacterium JH1-16]